MAAALAIHAPSLFGQTAAPAGVGDESDALKRAQWLNSRVPPRVPRRNVTRFSETRPIEARAIESNPAAPRLPEPPTAESQPTAVTAAEPPPAETRPAAVKPPEAKPAAAEAPKPKTAATKKTGSKTKPVKTDPPKILEAKLTEARPIESKESKSGGPKTGEPRPPEPPAAEAKPATGKILEARLTDPRAAEVKPSPAKPRESQVTEPPAPTSIPVAPPTVEPPPLRHHSAGVSNRYPWKQQIVTTVFWVGEPVGGNNFTHNFSSSWDARWARNYGGFDNPNPNARRNFLPVKFTPRQNPFYVALPYNDVTRGTTKPEARLVIPWFKDTFVKEGQSVCRDRWVAVRNRAGRIGYAQWSDCGPFRTDHWQYVFGREKPKPNLNKGAGLDVSPALRDYLGLDGTDLTDWKFVEARDVPSGPWTLHGENNPFAQKTSRLPEKAARSSSRAAAHTAPRRVREL